MPSSRMQSTIAAGLVTAICMGLSIDLGVLPFVPPSRAWANAMPSPEELTNDSIHEIRGRIDTYLLSSSKNRDEYLQAVELGQTVTLFMGEDGKAHPAYVEGLRYLDNMYHRYAEDSRHSIALLTLGKNLQLRWERFYAMGLGQKRVDDLYAGTGIGAIVGVLSFLRGRFEPKAIKDYFLFWRALRFNPNSTADIAKSSAAMVAGAYVGGQVTSGLQHLGALADEHTPPAPADLLRFGVIDGSLQYTDENALLNSLINRSAGMVATTVVYDTLQRARWLGWLNRAGTIVKINPVALILSSVVGWFVDDSLDDGDIREKRGMTMLRIRECVEKIEGAAIIGDHRTLFAESGKLAKLAMNLSALLGVEIQTALQEFQAEQQEALVEFEEASERYRVQHGYQCSLKEPPYKTELRTSLKDSMADLQDTINRYTGDWVQQYDADYDIYVAIGMLRRKSMEQPDLYLPQFDSSPTAQGRARFFVESFRKIMNQHGGHKLPAPERAAAFKYYLNGLEAKQNAILSKPFRTNGKMMASPRGILVQTAAYLRDVDQRRRDRQSGKKPTFVELILDWNPNQILFGSNEPKGYPYILSYADELLALVRSNDQLVALYSEIKPVDIADEAIAAKELRGKL